MTDMHHPHRKGASGANIIRDGEYVTPNIFFMDSPAGLSASPIADARADYKRSLAKQRHDIHCRSRGWDIPFAADEKRSTEAAAEAAPAEAIVSKSATKEQKELANWAALLAAGHITETEYEAKKAELLKLQIEDARSRHRGEMSAHKVNMRDAWKRR